MDAHLNGQELKEIKDALIKMSENIQKTQDRPDPVAYPAPYPAQPVTGTINNPLVWISFGGFLIVMLGTLLFSIYSNDKSDFTNKTNINAVAIKDLARSLEENQRITIQIQSNQETMLGALKTNNERTERALAGLIDVDRDRFNDKDGADLKDTLKDMIEDFENDARAELGQIKIDIKNIRDDITDFRLLENMVKQNTQALSDRSEFISDMKTRVRNLEIKENSYE